jgi:pilus assembly protein CpaF
MPCGTASARPDPGNFTGYTLVIYPFCRIPRLCNTEITASQNGLAQSHKEQHTHMAARQDLELVTLLEPLLADPSIMEIMADSYDRMYIEQRGALIDVDSPFTSADHMTAVLQEAFAHAGRKLDARNPMCDMRLDDGSRMNAVLPPIAMNGPTLVIRKFPRRPLTIDDILHFGSLNQDMATFLDACVKSRINIAVAGGTGSGKTTVLNILTRMVPVDERIIVVENATELKLPDHHRLVKLESRPPDADGRGEVTIRELIINALRMRPDRLILGEMRAGEALEMLQAMNTGHDGSLFSVHANSPRDTLARVEVMSLMAGMDLPLRAIRERVASAVQIITHQERMRDGKRRITKITEVTGMQGDVITMNDLFTFHQTGINDAGEIEGYFTATGLVPMFTQTIRGSGIDLSMDLFEPRYR